MKRVIGCAGLLILATHAQASLAAMDEKTALAKGCDYLRKEYSQILDCHEVKARLEVAGPELGGHIWLVQVPNPNPGQSYAFPAFYAVLSVDDGHLIQIGAVQY